MADWYQNPTISSRVVQAFDFHWSRFNDLLNCCPPAVYAVDALSADDSRALESIFSEASLFHDKDVFLERWEAHGARFSGNHRPFLPKSLYHVDYLFHAISVRFFIRVQVVRNPADLLPAWDTSDLVAIDQLLDSLGISSATYRTREFLRYSFLREHVERCFTNTIHEHCGLFPSGSSASTETPSDADTSDATQVTINDLSGAVIANAGLAFSSGAGASTIHQKIESDLTLELVLDRIRRDCPSADESAFASIASKIRDLGVQEAAKLLFRHLASGDWWAAARAAFGAGI